MRYGSVIYLGFGETWTETLRGRWDVRRFTVELEFGADDWSCLADEKVYLGSDRPDLSLERVDIDKMFVGGRLLSASSGNSRFDLSITGGIVIRSVIKGDQASGFLMALTLPDRTYETMDGEALVG